MTFSDILTYLHSGHAVRRAEYDPALIIFEQVPATITNIEKLQSVPNNVKTLLINQEVSINYCNQFILYDFLTETATYCVFDGDDLNATDWEVVDENYDPHECM
jgi:hypothetical protein